MIDAGNGHGCEVKYLISDAYTPASSKTSRDTHSSNDWQSAKSRISLVMPRDYARVLDVMAKAERSGLSVENEVMAVLNG